ncbi:unnamed protein product [Mytilus edulis]|uniref:Uncharacterized protein n=1 Tax=Mytilus edulis TaxID=6550 RepID=A0A8S3S6P0_MYTED|nr:unnamed protein product [Mytilus edulis]
MNKLVYSIWILLTIAITILTIFCIFNPAWYIHNNHIHSFGLTVFCEGLSTEDQQIQSRCQTYGGTFGLANIPSGAWQASFLLISTGAFSFGVTVILGILIHCIRERYVYSISSLVLYLQTSAVLLMISALVTFPVGLSSHYFRYYCGDSASVFYSANCSIGWSYMLAIMSVSLSIFCPVLWCFKEMKWNEFQFKEYV